MRGCNNLPRGKPYRDERCSLPSSARGERKGICCHASLLVALERYTVERPDFLHTRVHQQKTNRCHLGADWSISGEIASGKRQDRDRLSGTRLKRRQVVPFFRDRARDYPTTARRPPKPASWVSSCGFRNRRKVAALGIMAHERISE